MTHTLETAETDVREKYLLASKYMLSGNPLSKLIHCKVSKSGLETRGRLTASSVWGGGGGGGGVERVAHMEEVFREMFQGGKGAFETIPVLVVGLFFPAIPARQAG